MSNGSGYNDSGYRTETLFVDTPAFSVVRRRSDGTVVPTTAIIDLPYGITTKAGLAGQQVTVAMLSKMGSYLVISATPLPAGSRATLSTTPGKITAPGGTGVWSPGVLLQESLGDGAATEMLLHPYFIPAP